MRPLRIPFALDYIDETVNAFHTASYSNVELSEISWASDVLNEYFKHHKHVNIVNTARARYADTCITNQSAGTSIPFAYGVERAQHVAIDALTGLASQRNSVRWFQDRAVSRELLDNAVRVAVEAPTACNRQPFVFRIFDDRKIVQSILSVPYGAHGYAHNVPVVIVVIGQQRHFFSERDRHLIYVDSSLAVMGLLLGLEAQGLASCCIHWPDLSDREDMLSEIINLDDDERPILLIAVGYADAEGKIPFSRKKLLAQLRRYNFECDS